jgi:hypothetical protein
VRAVLHRVRGEPRGIRVRFGLSCTAWWAFDPDKLQAIPAGYRQDNGKHVVILYLGDEMPFALDRWNGLGRASVSLDGSGGVRVYIGRRILPINRRWSGKPVDVEGQVIFPTDKKEVPIITLDIPKKVVA